MEKESNKKTLILETARQVFAEKGFDGSRMDEIAARAGVKKSLIYYHFEGKHQLLQEILEMFFDDYGRLLRTETDGGTDDFLNRNSDILRIILIESLKKNTKLPAVFKAVKILMDYEKEISGDLDPAAYPSNHKRWVAELFTNLLPSACFVCYKDAWCKYFNVDAEILEQDFSDSLTETHGEYHKQKEPRYGEN